jgi:hypothetical protein
MAFTQVDYTHDTKVKNGEKFIVFTFENTSNDYVQKEVTISYMYYDGSLYHPYTKTFSLSMSPKEVYSGTLSYTTRDNNMIIRVNTDRFELKKFDVTMKDN